MKTQSMLVYVIITLIILLVIGTWFILFQKKLHVVTKESGVKHVEWSRNAFIYEVNIRQYSKNGTFKEFEKDLPRLKDLGVEILWIMPINPIGEKYRKGKLGSYYSVRDYKAINPEFGTMGDFKHLVKSIHQLGLHIIIDWVPNHTSWDNALFKTHSEYYLKDSTGKFASPFDWSDVVRLDYRNPATREYMIETMKWWLTETDIDGFRCDVAHMVPTDFWNELRPKLEQIKPVFMLAESDIPKQHQKGFDMSYDWKFHHIMNDIAKGKKNANAIMKHFNYVDSVYPGDSYLMEFTSNHDENSWNGTEYNRLGEGAKTFAVLAATIYGMPLIYNGQESAFNRSLQFFEKDSIDWDSYKLTSFYKKLIALKKENKALWNGDEGGPIQRITTNRDSSVFAFSREKENQKVIVICNLTRKSLEVKLNSKNISGHFKEIFIGENFNVLPVTKFSLKPWQYLVFEKQE